MVAADKPLQKLIYHFESCEAVSIWHTPQATHTHTHIYRLIHIYSPVAGQLIYERCVSESSIEHTAD